MQYENDPGDVTKYLKAQDAPFWKGGTVYEKALGEIKKGSKEEHWIWYVWPQIEGLGRSENTLYYGVPGLSGAGNYWKNQTLHDRYMEINEALLALPTDDLNTVMWQIDAMKVRSSITLFAMAADKIFGPDSEEKQCMAAVRKKFFSRIGYCDRTLKILMQNGEIDDFPDEW